MNRICLILIISMLFVLFPAKAQFKAVGLPSINNIYRSDYNAGTQNWAIYQDSNGIIYFGNNKGLLEFDGTNWQVYELPNRTILRSIATDKKNKIYVGGQNELGYFEPNEAGKTSYISLVDEIPTSHQNFEDIWKIFLMGDRQLFCAERAIFLFDNNQLKVISPIENRFENFFQIDNKIFIQEKGKGLLSLNEGRLLSVTNGELFSDERISAILPFEDERYLIVSFSKGLYIMDESGIQSWKTEASNIIITDQAYCAIEISDSRYAIGTTQNGMLIMDKDGMPIMRLNKNHGLQNNTVLSIYQDLQKNLWLGLDNGIDFIEINSPFLNIQSQAGIEGTGYASLFYNNLLYLGTNQGLYYTNWENIESSGDQKVFKAIENSKGQVWNINKLGDHVIASQHQGASSLIAEKAIPFSTLPGAWKFMELKANPGYGIEGTYSGLALYKNENDKNSSPGQNDWKFVQIIEGFNESARVFEEDNEGNLWISHTYQGVYKIRLAENLRSVETINSYDNKNGLPGELFINVTKIRNELVFTTPTGIFIFDKETDQFKEDAEFNSLFGEKKIIHRLIEDKLGNIWFSVDKEFGVIRVNQKGIFNNFQIQYFNHIQDDLVDGFEHVYVLDKDHILFGTEKGFILYDPQKPINIDFPYDILIRQVTSITERDSVVYWGNKSFDETNRVNLFNYEFNDFRFSYSAPSYEKIDYIRYRYILEGFEDTWSDWVKITNKEYTNLPADNYNFKVQARNAYGQLSNVSTFSFKISPPWYLSKLAKVIYFLLGLSLLAALVLYISRREEKKTEAFKLDQREKLQQKEAEFKKEVEKSEGEIITLKNEKLVADIDHKNSQLASTTMHLVQKSEILLKIKNDLQSLTEKKPADIKRKIDQISRTIESDIRLDNDWDQFEYYFDQVHENFFKRLRNQFPNLTPKDQKLCAYLRMNLTTKEIAPLLNISVRGVEISRYRLRKKLALESEDNLVSYIINI